MWQFSIDLIVLGCVFSGMQYFGFTLLFGFYATEVARYTYAKYAEKKQKPLTDEGFQRV